MKIFYATEEGHLLEYEDLVSNVKWKIQEFKAEGYTEQEIVQYDDNEQWRKIVQIILKLKD